MKEAINTASGELITAREAEYSMYYGIFLCPSCRKVVSLRKSFTQDGEVINASFVHQPRESNDESCPYRIDWGSEPLTVTTTLDINSKGQVFALLKKRFINIFSTYRMDSLDYDLNQDLSYKQKEYKGQLIKAASGILRFPNNQGILLQMKELIHTLGKASIKTYFDKLPRIDDDNNKRLMVLNRWFFNQSFYDEIARYNANKNNIYLTDADIINCRIFQNLIGLNMFFKEKENLSFLNILIAINMDKESIRFSSSSSFKLEKELEIFSFQSHTKVSLLVIDFLIFAAGESLRQKIMHIIFSKTDLLEAAIKQFEPEFIEAISLTVEKIKEQRNEPFKNFYTELNKEVSKRNIYSDLEVERDYAKFKNFLLFILAEVMIAIVNVNWMRGLPEANDDLLFLNRAKSRKHS
jgi:hypothetical protein